MFHAGYRCQLPPEGPPADGWWSCTWNFNSRFCVKQCHSGQKVFGMSVSYTSCTDSDGKWRFWPQQAAPDAYCVGKKHMAFPTFFSSVTLNPILLRFLNNKNMQDQYGEQYQIWGFFIFSTLQRFLQPLSYSSSTSIADIQAPR